MTIDYGRRMIVSHRRTGKFVLPVLLPVAALVIWAGPAHAAFTTFFGIDQGNGAPPTTPNRALAARNSFLSAISTVGVEDFESAGVGAPPATLSFSGSGVTAGATYSATESINNASDSGTVATSGMHYLDAGQGIRDDKIVFSSPVAGIGFYVTDLSDGGSAPDNISIIATLAGGGTQTFTTNTSANNSNANVLFFGVASSDASTLISQVEILNTFNSIDDVHGIDDVTVGVTPVPEAGCLATFSIVAGALARRRRRRAR